VARPSAADTVKKGMRRSASAASFKDAAQTQTTTPSGGFKKKLHEIMVPKPLAAAGGVGAGADGAGRCSPIHLAVDGGASDEGWQQQVVAVLWQQHPWADFDLVMAVAHSVGFDLEEAGAALQDMQLESNEDRRAAPGVRQKVDGYGKSQAANCNAAAAGAASGTAGSEDSDVTIAAAAPAVETEQGYGQNTSRNRVHGVEVKALEMTPSSRSSSRSSSKSNSNSRSNSSDDEADAYQRHRGGALKVTHAWRKALRR
jgi:hypothetical protein